MKSAKNKLYHNRKPSKYKYIGTYMYVNRRWHGGDFF